MNRRLFLFSGLSAAVASCKPSDADAGYAIYSIEAETASRMAESSSVATTPMHEKLAKAAEARLLVDVTYDPAYVALDYPGGDIPDDRGVCADLVIRAYRALDIDLQVDVHEDMAANFDAYPQAWGLSRPDHNIDHRRVLNLETYFTRMGGKLSDATSPGDIQPGDLVTWRINGRLPHIGIASTRTNAQGERLFVHNIGGGVQLEACYGAWPLTGVFRYRPWNNAD